MPSSIEGSDLLKASQCGPVSPAQPQEGTGWGTQGALYAAVSHHSPGRSSADCGRTLHACSSLEASLVNSSGSPGPRRYPQRVRRVREQGSDPCFW